MTLRQIVGAWVIRTMDRLGWVPKRKYENLQKITCGDIVVNAAVPVQMRVVGRETKWLVPGDMCSISFPEGATMVDVQVVPMKRED